MTDSETGETDDLRPSKSERKRKMLALQEMGERLVSLSRSELDQG